MFEDAEAAVLFTDDDISFVDGFVAFAGIDREHGEAHAEIRGEDSLAAELLDFVVVGTGVLTRFQALVPPGS